MKKLSIIIPAYNEEKTILEVLAKVKKTKLSLRKEIIVVSDGSTDRTAKLAATLKGIKVIDQQPNQGKGAAVRKGIESSTGEIVIIQDADLEYNPEEYEKIVKPLLDKTALVVYGSRFLGSEPRRLKIFSRKHKNAYSSAYFGAQVITFLTNLLFGTELTDEPTCYKCFESSLIKSIKIESDRFNWEPEVTAKIALKGINIYEVPISYNPRSFREGKKINWKDGIQAIWTLIKYRFNA